MSELPTIPADPSRRRTAPRKPVTERTVRKATGLSPWPVMLLAGGPKAPTARVAASASASRVIDRTFWLSWRERTPDALGTVAGARFEIVEHDNTLDDFEDALRLAVETSRGKGGRPHLIVVDGISQLWESVKDWGTADAVASSSGSYWYAVNDRWGRILARLREHAGPVLLIGRLDGDALLGHKDLAADVDVLVEVEDDDSARVTATRIEPPLRETHEDFAAESVWAALKVVTA